MVEGTLLFVKAFASSGYSVFQRSYDCRATFAGLLLRSFRQRERERHIHIHTYTCIPTSTALMRFLSYGDFIQVPFRNPLWGPKWLFMKELSKWGYYGVTISKPRDVRLQRPLGARV